MAQPTKDHPDDFMVVTITLELRAKANPANGPTDNPIPCDYTYTLPAGDEAKEELEAVVDAIEDRRLYGYVMQKIAECSTGAHEWIDKPVSEIAAEEGD